MMKRYQIKLLSKDGQVVWQHEFEGDDIAALFEARRHCEEHSVEVWEGSRWVARFEEAPAKG